MRKQQRCYDRRHCRKQPQAKPRAPAAIIHEHHRIFHAAIISV
jgi:hypothetical protein